MKYFRKILNLILLKEFRNFIKISKFIEDIYRTCSDNVITKLEKKDDLMHIKNKLQSIKTIKHKETLDYWLDFIDKKMKKLGN